MPACLELFKWAILVYLNALITSTIAQITNAIVSQVSLDLDHLARNAQPIRNGQMADVSVWSQITNGMI